MNKLKKHLVFVIPILYLVWSLQLNMVGGPFSLSRSDPEFPYLLNGLNCATLDFQNIGHTDHPGTPFQMITGLFIQVTHLVIGQGPIVEEVLASPEIYLAAASLFLSILTFFLLLWVGRIAEGNKGKLTGAVILQCTFLLSSVLVDMPLRYSPDRMLVIYNLILAGLTLKFLFSEDHPVSRYAILTGILMGIGFATKFNYLPVLAIPLFLIPDFRNRAKYVVAIAVSFFVSLIPILSKFKEFRRFISGVVSHDGLYGHGSQQMINWKSFIHNFGELLYYNPAYTIILALSLGLIVFYFLNKERLQAEKPLFQILKAFAVASLIGIILVSKHFKVYYFAPVLSLSGLILFIIWKICGPWVKSEKMRPMAIYGVLTFLVGVSVFTLPGHYRSRMVQKKANLKTAQFYKTNSSIKDLLFIEPTWLAGPMAENALVYGISYVAHRHEFYHYYRDLYPNVITWEGEGKNPGLFRTAEADPESILFSGRDIFIFSSPERNAGMLVNYLDTLAVRYGTRMVRDTVFRNPDNADVVIRARNGDGWETLRVVRDLTEATDLSPLKPVSELRTINGVRAGDYLEITLRIKGNDPDARGRLIARSAESASDGIYFEDSGSLQDIGHGWQLLRLRGRINNTPAGGEMLCQVYYPGSKKLTIQDLEINHMGRRVTLN